MANPFVFHDDDLVIDIRHVAAITADPTLGGKKKFVAILDVPVAASGAHNNFHGPVKVFITEWQRKAILRAMLEGSY